MTPSLTSRAPLAPEQANYETATDADRAAAHVECAITGAVEAAEEDLIIGGERAIAHCPGPRANVSDDNVAIDQTAK